MSASARAWVDHVTWWHVYPLGFTGAPIREGADEGRIVHRLPHIEAWLDHVIDLGLNGILLGPVFASTSHGYDIVDHFRVDPRLGDEDDVRRLIAAAHDRGVRVLFDGVFNHVGREHPQVETLRGDGVFEGHDSLVELDHDSEAVRDLAVDAMNYWLDRGIDGWRLDAAYAVPPSFWAAVLPRVRERHPHAWFLGEVIHGDYATTVRDSGIDSVTQYELWQGIWHGIADGNFFELAHALGRHVALLDTFVPATFVGNHDVTRIATAVGRRHLPHALAVLFTVAGTPAVYAGDEYGFEAVKAERIGGDDAVRPAFPPMPDEVEETDAARDALRLTRDLVAFRRRRPWLHSAHTDVVETTNLTLVIRTAVDDDAAIVALNIGDDEAVVAAAGAGQLELGDGALADARVVLPPHGWAILT